MTDQRHADSEAYLQKKQFFNQLLTIYGRKPVLEALQEPSTKVFRLHLAESNRGGGIIDDIIKLATDKGAEVLYHDRKSLARLSKNSKQDQGVVADLICEGYKDYRDFLKQQEIQQQKCDEPYDIIALDRITNPQNLGMIIRSVCAGQTTALLLPNKGCAKLDALVIKASTGTIFRAPILRCDSLPKALQDFRAAGCDVYGLSSHANTQIGEMDKNKKPAVFVLGNETEGVSKEVEQQCNAMVSIPMQRNVESLNVAVTASLLAFRKVFRGN